MKNNQKNSILLIQFVDNVYLVEIILRLMEQLIYIVNTKILQYLATKPQDGIL